MANTLSIDYRYDEAPTLEDFSNSNARVRGLMGPFASGKSSACVAEIPQRAQDMPLAPDGIRHSRYAVIRNTYNQLRDTTIRTVNQWLPPAHFGKFVESRHSYMIKALPQTECEILYIALDRPEDISKLLSLELTGAWVNEAREVPWSIINALQGRIGRYPPVSLAGPYWHGIWMDTNPPDSDSEWYKFFEEETWKKSLNKMRESGQIDRTFRDQDFAQIFKQPSGLESNAENLKYLKSGYYQELAIGKSEEWIKVYVHGQYGFVAEGKLVYPEYNDRIHCQAVDPMPGVTIIRSWDFGLTPACIFSQMLPDGRWLTFDEMVSEDMSIDEFSDEVLEHCNRSFRGQATFEDLGDPAGEQRAQTDKRTCFEIMNNKGILIEGSIQDPKLRQESVRKALRTLVAGEAQFILHPRCKTLRKGFMGGYRRRRMQTPGTPRYTEQPDKNFYSHCFPADVTVSTPNGDVPIADLRIGDMVDTPIGPRAVMATMNRMAPQIAEISTRAGRHLPCTPDHPIWSEGCFVRADTLQYGDVLETSPWVDQQSIKFRHSMELATTSGQKDTTARTMSRTAAGICTAMFGSTTMAQSPTVGTSTTATTIAAIMTSPIWRLSLGRIISANTALNGMLKILSAASRTWICSGVKRQYGTALMQAAHGIARTRSRLLRACLWNPQPVCIATVPMRLSAGSANVAIAHRLASRLRAVHAGTTMSNESAQSAPLHLRQAVSARPGHADVVAALCLSHRQNERVYDLTIDEAHCFYANGILVSNCHDALQYGMVFYLGGALTDRPRDDDDFAPREDYTALGDRSQFTGY